MAMPVLERDETLSSLADSSRRWTELLRSVTDATPTAIGHWTIRDVAVHTSHLFGVFPELIDGGRSPIQDHLNLAAEWDAKAKSDPESDLNVIADRVDLATKEFINRATTDKWTSEVWWHGGLKVPVYSLAGILINEAELHGLDVAEASGRDWSVTREKATKAMIGLFPILPYFVREDEAKKFNATFELRVRGGPKVYITVEGGALTIDMQPRAVDCHLSVDPVDYLLIGYGRKSQLVPIATGKVAAWGKKPWLSLRFAKLFHTP